MKDIFIDYHNVRDVFLHTLNGKCSVHLDIGI